MQTRLAIVLLSAACSQTPPPAKTTTAQTPPVAWSEATFAANVRTEVSRRFPGAKVDELEADLLRVTPKTGDVVEVNFIKARAWCREDWTRCAAAVDRTFAALAEIHQATPVTRAQLRIVLRTMEKVAAVKARAKTITAKPFSSDAQWLLAADLPDMIRLDITGRDLGLSDDDAWQIATTNVKPAKVVTQASQSVLIYQDDYAPSALLYPAVLLAAAHQALPSRTGNLLVACPEENIILYTLGGAAEAARLRDAAASGSKNSTMPLSTRVMEWTGSAWREAR